MERVNIRNINFYARKRAYLIKQLGKVDPFINGAIVKLARVCGNKNCKCTRDEKHVSYYFTYRDKYKKRTNIIYIPVGLLQEVREWNAEYKRIKRVVEEICKIQRRIIRQYVREKKRPKR